MSSNSMKDLTEASSGVHFSGLHINTETHNNTHVEQASTSMTGKPQKQPFVIGVAGGASSGKKTVGDMIIDQLHDQRVVLVNQVHLCPSNSTTGIDYEALDRSDFRFL